MANPRTKVRLKGVVWWSLTRLVLVLSITFVWTRNPQISLGVTLSVALLEVGFAILIGRRPSRKPSATPAESAVVLWFTGLSGAGKTTIATEVAKSLRDRGIEVAWLDGDVTREYFPRTGFSREERDAHVIKSGFVAKMLVEHGVTVVASYISPYAETREKIRKMVGSDHFVEIYVSTPISECERRDIKGLYAKARRGEIQQFTGIDDPYEPPESPEIEINTLGRSPLQSRDVVLRWLEKSPSET